MTAQIAVHAPALRSHGRRRYRDHGAGFKLVCMSYSYALIIHLIIQAALIVHCIRTGRNMLWILAILLLPVAGPIAYVIVELLPGMVGGSGTRRTLRGMQQALDPGYDLRRYEAEVRRSGDVASRQHYAEALLRAGRPQEAIEVYRQALTGLYASDPNLLLGLARAQFEQGAAAEARTTLDELNARNPQFRSPDAHLLYARALEAEGNRERALAEYAAVSRYYAGAEAPARYAHLLRECGKKEEARGVLKELLEHARLAPRYYRRMQREWLLQAERELSGLS